MAGNHIIWKAFRPFFMVLLSFLLASILVSAERSFKTESLSHNSTGVSNYDSDIGFFTSFSNFIWQADKSGYKRVWPEMKFSWKIVIGSIIGFTGAAFGSVGGVGGGGIFVPMLSLVVGFDPKSSTAMSKCMIMGASGSTVYYNLRLRHPNLDMPIIDYDLAVLIQPMLMLGISIGVAFNVIFADWMVTVLLIVLFVGCSYFSIICHPLSATLLPCLLSRLVAGTSTKSFLKGVETWKKETIIKEETAKRLHMIVDNGRDEAEYKLLPGGPNNHTKNQTKSEEQQVGILKNVCWKELGLLVFVWVAYLALQIIKNNTRTCSTMYWLVNLLQIPVSLGVSGYESVSLYKGWRKIASKGDEGTSFRVSQLITYSLCGVLAGMVGGLLGLGGGFIMGPLFLELGIPPQVSSATATFAMMFSSSMSVVEYYLLKRFPVPYALYFMGVAMVAAFIGQHVVRRLILVMGRASIIIFILSSTIFVSAITLGGVGISNMIRKIHGHEYMGFENLCKYQV